MNEIVPCYATARKARRKKMINFETIKNGDNLYSFSDKHVFKVVLVKALITASSYQCAVISPTSISQVNLPLRIYNVEELFYTAKEAFDGMIKKMKSDCDNAEQTAKEYFSREYPETIKE